MLRFSKVIMSAICITIDLNSSGATVRTSHVPRCIIIVIVIIVVVVVVVVVTINHIKESAEFQSYHLVSLVPRLYG